MNKKYFAYIRVSTVKQGEGISLEAQREAITNYANQHGLSISQWFEEKETAAKKGRPLFDEIIRSLKSGKADGVIMHKIDRSARNLRDWASVGELQDAGIDVHFAAESVDFASRGGRLTADIQAVIAADYIRNLREETLKGINGRLKQGLYPFKAPIGYVDTGKGKAKTICPIRGPKVMQLFECYATGEHSLLSLVAEAKKIGLTSSRNGPVTKTCIENMLRNPFYIGLIYIRSRKEIFDGKHEPLISVELFKKVEAVRAGRHVKKVTKHDCTFRRMFKCGRCNRVYSGELQKGHTYYRCHTKNCTRGGVREEAIEGSVAKFLLDEQITAPQSIALKTALERWSFTILKPENSAPTTMQLGNLQNKQAQLLEAFLDGLIDKETFQTRKAQFLVQEKELYNISNKQLTNEQILQHAGKLFELFKSLYLTYSLANSAEKRQLLKILFSNRIITDKNVELEPRNWMRKATNLVTVLNGAHSEDTIRRGVTLPVLETEELKSLFDCQEWKELSQLYAEISKRNSEYALPETVTQTPYKIAA